jgi:mono/diheme cytochrome c family protein
MTLVLFTIMPRTAHWVVVLVALLLCTLPATAQQRVDFAGEIQPIFARVCYQCHGPQKQRSDFRLDVKADALRGGSIGVAIVPGKSADSPLLRYIAGLDKNVVMPPKGERLTAPEIELIRAWIDQGAAWPANDKAPAAKADVWWSLRPLARPRVPEVVHPALPIRNPIDAFVLAKLREQKLGPSPEADRRTLIRRVTFDLIGLPAAPEEIDAFLGDASSDAYERLVDRLLASPQYGERWARHWLDVVHYGETHGYDKDKPRPNAWPYRDYVIRAFNEDRPYGRFVQEQLAGDVLFPGNVDGIEALGFLSSGPWDLIGHTEVPEDRIDGKITRHLDRDDMVATTIGTFNSMTVHCAQCHHHKFDPIPQEDYYRLQAVFAAIDRADKQYDVDPTVAVKRRTLETRRQTAAARLKVLQDHWAQRAGPALAALDRRIADGSQSTTQGRRPEFGYHSALSSDMMRTKWVQVDLGKRIAVKEIIYVGCHDDFNNIGAGFGFPLRFKVELSDDPQFQSSVITIVDHTAADVPNPGTEPQTVAADGKEGRFVRVTATKLAPRQGDFMFALAELSVIDEAGNNVALNAPVTALDTIEAPPRWSMKNLVDGIASPRVTRLPAAELAQLKAKRQALLEQAATPELQQQTEEARHELAEAQQALATLPPPRLVYCGAIYQGTGAFSGSGSRPRPIFILPRGDVRKPGKEVGPGALSAVTGLRARFDLPAGHTEGERRAALAHWITDPNNGLTWRSIVNRIWLYHMGRGIVDSPNDFGKMGQLPTHPELLDWLAVEFREGGQSLKRLHKLIVTSSTYRQASADNPALARVDSGNQYYWRMTRRKLEAEAVRDSILHVSGKLDLRMGGPSFQDFVIERPEHSPHYLYNLHDAEDPRSHRRSIYRFIVRSQPQPFLATLDCADPSLAVEKRNQTITPQQALAILNNQLTIAMARHFAARVAREENDPAAQVRIAFRLALGRTPTDAEQDVLSGYAERYGLAGVCRVMFNLNEFVFAD